MIKAKGLLFFLALSWVPAHAGTILYTDSGTFTASTPSSVFTGPGETWAFSFEAETNPTVLEFGMGGFDFAYSDFSYLLNGSPVAITPSFIRFFSPNNGGGFYICFNGTTVQNCTEAMGTGNFVPAVYTGTTSAPTLLTGSFPGELGVAVGSGGADEGPTTLIGTAVPEPSTLLTLAPFLVALAGRRLYRRT